MDINYLLIKSNAQIKEAITILENTDKGIVLVVDTKNILIGTVTDGDIRRGLLKKYTLNSLKLSKINKSLYSLDKMTKEVGVMLDKYVPEFPKEVKLELPKLKKVGQSETPKMKLPKLKKV